MSRLSQIPGVTAPLTELLRSAGLETLGDVATTPAQEIVARLEEANREGQMVAQVPSVQAVSTWQRAARALDETAAGAQLPSMASAGAGPDGVAGLKTAGAVSAREIQKLGVSVSEVPVARLLDEDRRRPAAT
ncbi:MAG: DUF4332 domain-containing protein, partial [Akkermansiaceae bacterium]|nr:DUF4332 domain-containing protein [Akkermansiaceae bacterium]